MGKSSERRDDPKLSQRQRVFKKMKHLAKAIESLAWAVKNHNIARAATELYDTVREEYS